MGADHSRELEGVDLSGKVCIVTGANTGIGYVNVREIARAKAHVIMACRSKQRGEEALKILKSELGEDSKVELMILDLGSLQSVRDFVLEFKSKNLPLNILVNNAAIMNTPYAKTVDGIENQFGTNHIGHFLLTLSLIDVIKASAPARIVNVSSGAYAFGGIDFTDINLEKNGAYGGWGAYSRSKLCNVLFTYELARRLQGTKVTANALHPGFVRTQLARDSGAAVGFAAKLFGKTPEKGAETSLFLAASPRVDGETGKYFQNCTATSTNSLSHNQDVTQKLWEVSLKLTGLTDDILPAS